MTDYFIGGRGVGKTHRALERMLDDPDLYYVTHTMQAGDWAYRMALRISKEVRHVHLSIDEERALRKRFVSLDSMGVPRGRRVIVDNAEMVLSRVLGGAEIEIITGTGTITDLNYHPEGNPQ